MADILNPGALTVPEDFSRSIAQMVFEQVIAPNAFNKYFTMTPNVIYNTRVPFFEQLGHTMGAPIACGTPITGASQLGSYEKVWEPEVVQLKASMCYADMYKTLQAILIKYNYEPYKLEESAEFRKFLSNIFTPEYWAREHWAMYYLSDKNYVAADFTGASTIALDFYTRINGIWKQIVAEATDVSVYAPLLTAANAEPNYADQKAFLVANPTTATEALEALFMGARPELKNNKSKLIGLTDDLWWSYKRSLTGSGNVGAWNFGQYDANTNTLYYYDTPVINLTEVSQSLFNDFKIAPTVGVYNPNDPTGVGFRINDVHRAVMFIKENQMVAVDGKGLLQDFYYLPNASTRVLQITGEYQTDAKIGIPYMHAFCK